MIRAWLPMFLQKGRGYSESVSLSFMSAYYISTDVGCLLAGAGALRLAKRGLSAHSSRLITYAVCAMITALTIVAAQLGASVWLLLVLLCVGAGSLGLFPCYYSFTQEIDALRVGKVTGLLSFLGWILTAPVHPFFGKIVDDTGQWSTGLACVGCVPLIGLLAMLLLWPKQADFIEQPEPPSRTAVLCRSASPRHLSTNRVISSTFLICYCEDCTNSRTAVLCRSASPRHLSTNRVISQHFLELLLRRLHQLRTAVLCRSASPRHLSTNRVISHFLELLLRRLHQRERQSSAVRRHRAT